MPSQKLKPGKVLTLSNVNYYVINDFALSSCSLFSCRFTSAVWKVIHFVYDNFDKVLQNWYQCSVCNKIIHCKVRDGNKRLSNHSCVVAAIAATKGESSSAAGSSNAKGVATDESSSKQLKKKILRNALVPLHWKVNHRNAKEPKEVLIFLHS